MNDAKSLQALISLMDDPDEQIYAHVKSRVMEFGPQAIQLLESSWEEKDYGLLFQNRIEKLIHEIQFEECKRQLSAWYQSSSKDLLKGSIIISKYQYPGFNEKLVYDFVDKVYRDCWLEINESYTAFELVGVINKIFYEKYQFNGNSKNYQSPLNSFINTVIETKKGNPLSLSVLYSVIAQKLKLPIFGVNLPNHFVLAYMDNNGINQYVSNPNEYGVLFYINAFSKGSMLQKEDIIQFLNGIHVQPNHSHFQPCSNSDILRRMLTNLISSFQQVGNSEKVNELIELRSLLD